MGLEMSPNHGTDPGRTPRPGEFLAPGHGANGVTRGGETGGPGTLGGSGSARLSAEEFGRRFGDSWRVLWCAAVSVVRDRTLAQDVVQQAAIVGLERLDDFDTGTNFVSWMVRIVKNIALNEARKRSRRRTHPTETATLDSHAGGGSGAEQQGLGPGVVLSGRGGVLPDQGAFDDEVLHALDDLDDTARGCLLLRVVLDLTYRDIALALDIPEGTAASHVHRARKTMRERLRERFGAARSEEGGRA